MIVKNHIDETNDLKLIADNKSHTHTHIYNVFILISRFLSSDRVAGNNAATKTHIYA